MSSQGTKGLNNDLIFCNQQHQYLGKIGYFYIMTSLAAHVKALHLLNIVIAILQLKELAVILERWDPADGRKYMPDGHDRPL